MSDTIETQALVVRPSMSVGQALGVDEIIAQVNLIQSVMHKVMKEGEHYGTIPGCEGKDKEKPKKTLLQPGAQKLTMTFRLCPEYQIQETNLERGHKEYRVICTLKSMQSGSFVGQGVGCCSTMESKYRWRGGSRKCPECGKETIIKGKAEYGGGWLCFQKKGGCGAKWPDGAQEIEGQSIERVEHDNPADFYNTVLKMSKKRAFVDATITATAASDIFTQDVGDDEPSDDPPDTTKTPPSASQTSKKPISVSPNTPDQTDEGKANRQMFLATLEKQAGKPFFPAIERFLRNSEISGVTWLMPNETLNDLRQDRLRRLVNQWESLFPKIEQWLAEHPETPKQAELSVDWFWPVICPIPHKGERRDEYLKHPDTIKSLYDATKQGDKASQDRLFGFANKWQPTSRVYQGTTYEPSEADLQFRKALDAFLEWESEQGKNPLTDVMSQHMPEPDEDSVPF